MCSSECWTVTVVSVLCDGFLCVPVSVWTVTVVRVLCDGCLFFCLFLFSVSVGL